MGLVNWIELNQLGDERGELVAIESLRDLPFEVKRIYYIYNTEGGGSRGFHAHKALEQLAICVSGSCEMYLDDGVNKAKVRLDSPSKGILIGNLVWRELHNFSDDCVLLVLASEYYDENDYIRDYKEFLREVQK